MLGCVVAGTLPSAGCKQMEQMVRWDVEPQWVVSSAEEAGLVNGYDHPSRLGADRWVAMVGARHHVLARPGAAAGGGDGGHRRDGGMH
jgi:type III pantothenate kinase